MHPIPEGYASAGNCLCLYAIVRVERGEHVSQEKTDRICRYRRADWDFDIRTKALMIDRIFAGS